MDEKIVERVLKQHETRLIMLSNNLKWLEKMLDARKVIDTRNHARHMFVCGEVVGLDDRIKALEQRIDNLRVEQDGRLKRLV